MTNDRYKPQAIQYISAKPTIGVSTRKGTKVGKSVNEDAFIIAPMADGKMWLMAIADGVTNSPNSWWASHKCMELIWRTMPDYGAKFLSPETSESELKIMQQWINAIHQNFLLARRNAPTEFQKATSTLTFTVVRETSFFWAHCGDTRLYKLPQAGKLSAVFSDQHLGRDREGKLVNHIAAGKDWQAVVNKDSIPPKSLLLLCSDGVVSGNKDLQKTHLLTTLRDSRDNLQKRVEEITATVASQGETDDLTLIAFQPGDN